MRGLRPALAAVLASAGIAAASAQPAPSAVVGAGTPAEAAGVASDLRDQGFDATVIPRIGAVRVDDADAARVRDALGGREGIDWVEPDRTRTLFVTSPDETVDQLTGRVFGWALDTIEGSDAVELAPPNLPVTVAVVDSGVDAGHPDLAGRIGPAFDVLSGGTGVKDLVGHGTFIAGLISAIDGNGIGSHGVAGATTVLPIRITTTGSIKAADAAAGIVHAVDAGAGVINLSFGGNSISDVEKAALAYAASRNVLVVAAAGNKYLDGNPLQYPAAALGGVKGGWSPGLSVAATTPLGRHAPFSTANDFVSVAAPGAGSGTCGDGVFSTLPANLTTLWDGASSTCNRVVLDLTTLTGRYGYGEGTSFAAPLVAGAAALVRDTNPALTAEQTADVIRRSAHQTQGSGWNAQTGAGVLDAAAAVSLARVYDTAPPPPTLTTTPLAGGVLEDFTTADAGVPGGQPSGVASYSLARSTDQKTWTPITPTSPPAAYLETGDQATGQRWFRAAVCDVTHNCATKVFRTTATPPPPPPPRVTIQFQTRHVSRPLRCATCVRVSVATAGAGPVRWRLVVRVTGIRTPVMAGGILAAGRTLTKTLRLPRLPLCRGRITVTTLLTSGGKTIRGVNVLHVRRSCRPAGRRTHR